MPEFEPFVSPDENRPEFTFRALLLGSLFGIIFGSTQWWHSISTEIPASSGTVILATLPIILGFQLLLSFITFDISNEPSIPLQRVSDPGSGMEPSAAAQSAS